MDLEVLARARAAFERVVDLPADERAAELAKLAAEDPELARAVEELLAADQEAFGALDTVDGLAGVVHRAAGLAVPARIGEFEILGELGRGGMGVVYEARQAFPARRVALKTLHPLRHGEAARAQFLREVDILARVLHPGIPQVYGAFDADGAPVLVMELVEGDPLPKAAAGRSLDERLAWMVQVADAVAHAHHRGVVHRDIKPGNVLVERESGRVKVLDFGIAALDDETARSGGTLAYVAPEQLGDAPVDARADVYGLGATLFELVTGRSPLTGDAVTSVATALAAKSTPPPLSEDVPAELAAVVRMAMSPTVEGRQATAADFADDLRRIRAHRVPRALEDDPGARLRSWWRRSRRSLALGAAATALGSLLVPLGQSALDRQAEARRVGAAEAALGVALALEDPQQRRASLRALVEDEGLLGTPVLAQAWLALAEEATGADDRLLALAAAFAHATSRATEERSLTALARELVRQGQWASLVAVVQRLGDAADPDLVQLAALSSGDWARAKAVMPADLAPLVDLFEHARPDSAFVGDGEVDLDGARWSFREGHLRRHGPTGEVEQDVEVPWSGVAHLPPPIAFHDGQVRLVTPLGGPMVDVAGDGSATRLPWPGTTWTLGMRIDGDRTLVGVDDPHGGLLVADARGVRPYDPHLVDTRGYVYRVRLADLNGDGVDEVAYGVHGWGLRDLRVRDEVSGQLATYRIGLRRFDIAHTPQGPRIVALGLDPTLPPLVEEALRTPPTLVTLALRDGALVELARTPIDFLASRVHVGDLDGDGFDEVIVSRHEVEMAVGRLDDQGRWRGFLVPGVWLHRVADLDEDDADEVWMVRDGSRSGVLGVPGGEPLDMALPEPPHVALTVPDTASTQVRERVRRIGVLADLGLRYEASELLLALADADPSMAADALDQGLRLTKGLRDEVDEERRLRIGATRSELARRRVRLDGPPPDEAVEVLRDAHAWDDLPPGLGPSWTASDELRPTDGLPDATWVLRPGSVAWDPVRRRLAADTMSREGDVLGFAIEPADEALEVTLDLRWLEQDFGSKLRVDLGTGPSALGFESLRGGGGPRENRTNTVICGPRGVGYGDLDVVSGPVFPEDVQLRLTWERRGGQVRLRCQVGDLISSWTGPDDGRPAPDVISLARPVDDADAARVLVGIDRVRIRGGRFVRAPSPALDVFLAPTAPPPLADRSDAELLRLVRTRPETSLAAIRAAVPDRFPDLVAAVLVRLTERDDSPHGGLLASDALADLPLRSDDLRTLVARRAEALITEGRLAEARHEIERLRTRDDALVGSLLAARLDAAVGDLDAARDTVARLLQTSRTPELALIQVHADPVLAPLAPLPLPPGLDPP
ncbi:MAG: serine/threonine protein kinase [Alphaproteobacteria bacterium]|nr:serine/threonine protein kinase [Alphaproteobacteria bacterium]